MIRLSYVITTYNKLPYLKEVMDHLLKHVEADEEIVVTDGASTDGTVDYLETLFREKKIHNYISEKDKGEAHGFNKAILLSRGEIIKIITDDDAFYYPAIRASKQFMLSHPEVDALGGNTGGVDMGDKNSIYFAENFEIDYDSWKEKKLERFFFNGTCLMIRKSSIALLGLFNTNILLNDLEYTLRITGVANLAWCKGLMSIRILNEQSNNTKFVERSKKEDKDLCDFYHYKHFQERNKEQQEKGSNLLRQGYKSLSSVRSNLLRQNSKHPAKAIAVPFNNFIEAHKFSLNWLSNHSLNQTIYFNHKHADL